MARAQSLVAGFFADDFAAERVQAGLAAMAPNSVAAMVSDVRHYRTWAGKVKLAPFPLDEAAIGRYLDGLERSGRKASTAARRLASLGRFVRLVGQREQLLVLQSDYVRDKLRGYERRKGVRVRKAAPIRFGNAADPIAGEGLNVMGLIAACGEDLRGLRDAAMMMALYGGGLRVNELIALRVGDVREDGQGRAVLFLKSSKTDQVGAGTTVGLPAVAAKLIERWIEAAGIWYDKEAPLFRRVFAVRPPVRELPHPRQDGRSLVEYAKEVRRVEAARVAAKREPLQLEPGRHPMTRQGVLHIVRTVVAAAIDGSFVDIGGLDRDEVIAGVGTHSFRIGLTHDLFARNFDLGRVMLAQRWTSATTAVGYARDLAGRSSAVGELFDQFEAGRAAIGITQD
ncbi:MAG: tyrosine-type recombinase/integrase [Betaproteobacteria bacterium]|nr:tyrosine-type recombinase/integrase [Betaproteobacteria bacterium]